MVISVAAAPIDSPARTTSANAVSDSARPYRGRRISWEEFYRLMDEVANDNAKREEAA